MSGNVSRDCLEPTFFSTVRRFILKIPSNRIGEDSLFVAASFPRRNVERQIYFNRRSRPTHSRTESRLLVALTAATR